jgi:hypothetical protein
VRSDFSHYDRYEGFKLRVKEDALSNHVDRRHCWVIWVFCFLPLYACGDKATTAAPAERVANQSTTNRSLSSMGGGSAEQSFTEPPRESLKVDENAVQGRVKESRSTKEIELCVDDKARAFKGPDGVATAPGAEDLQRWIEECGD